MNMWQSRLMERRAQFIVRSTEKLNGTGELIVRLQKKPSDKEALKQINKDFHQLAGAGGIYELTELCDLSIAGEELCSRLLNENLQPSPVDLQKMTALVNSIIRSLQEVDKAIPQP